MLRASLAIQAAPITPFTSLISSSGNLPASCSIHQVTSYYSWCFLVDRAIHRRKVHKFGPESDAAAFPAVTHLFYKPPSRNGKGWGRSSPNRLPVETIRFYPESPMVSSSESSLLEERTPENPPYYDVYVTPRRARRSSGAVHEETASGCVLIPNGTFKLIIWPG